MAKSRGEGEIKQTLALYLMKRGGGEEGEEDERGGVRIVI